jgi:hypothetical protein
LWALVGAFKAGKTFIARNTGFGGGLSGETNLIDGKAGRHSRRWTSSFEIEKVACS